MSDDTKPLNDTIVGGIDHRTYMEQLTLVGEEGTRLTLTDKPFFRETYPLTHSEGVDRIGITDEYTREQLIVLRDFIDRIIGKD